GGDERGPRGGEGGEQRGAGGGRGGDVHGDGAQPRAEPGDGRGGHRRAARGPDLRGGHAVGGDVRLRYRRLDGGDTAGDAASDAVAAGAGGGGGHVHEHGHGDQRRAGSEPAEQLGECRRDGGAAGRPGDHQDRRRG